MNREDWLKLDWVEEHSDELFIVQAPTGGWAFLAPDTLERMNDRGLARAMAQMLVDLAGGDEMQTRACVMAEPLIDCMLTKEQRTKAARKPRASRLDQIKARFPEDVAALWARNPALRGSDLQTAKALVRLWAADGVVEPPTLRTVGRWISALPAG